MCGIAGVASSRASEIERLEDRFSAVDSAIAHRGPNGSGMYADAHCVLLHRRLSIIDTSDDSAQPMASPSTNLQIVFNGEIYNYVELRIELRALGKQFQTTGDTEVLLRAFEAWDVGCFERLNGMFAVAIWDSQSKRLVLARDRFGKKPLYLYQSGTHVAFASELRAVLEFGVSKFKIDSDSLRSLLQYQHMPSGKTILEGITQIQPGHYSDISFASAGVRLTEQRYWHPTFAVAGRIDQELDQLLADAVNIRLRSDVPVGVLLSGGIDSILIGSYVSQLRKTEVTTFTVGFDDPTFDESRRAAHAARALGFSHSLLMVRDSELADACLSALGSLQEPLADPSAIPLWLICRHASTECRVLLTGDGADELFGGYRRYRAGYLLSVLEKFRGVQFIKRGLGFLPRDATGNYFATSFLKKAELLTRFAASVQSGRLFPQHYTEQELGALMVHPARSTLSANNAKIDSELPNAMMHWDLLNYLPQDILVKSDRMSMAHGTELRSPFLDFRIAEFAMNLPLNQKLGIGHKQKRYLRQLAEKRLPGAVIDGPKHGFSVPVSSLLRGALRKTFEALVIDTELFGYARPHALNSLWAEHLQKKHDHGFRAWGLLCFAIWYQQHQRFIAL
jgi:asparagine synthase (glutamine-hydrolysing)